MPTSLRLNPAEQERVRSITMAINKTLLSKQLPALQESEVLHKILEYALSNIELKDFEKSSNPKRLN